MHFLCTFFNFVCTKPLYFMKKIAILASGEGTNAEQIIKHFASNNIAKTTVVLTNSPQAGVIHRAKSLHVPVDILTPKEFKEGKAIELLRNYQVEFIVLAGFLLHIPNNILDNYPNKIVNIHPSLLPKFGGKGMYGKYVHEAVLASNESESGITIHYVNEHYDEGIIILQVQCPVIPNDTPKTLADRVHQLEYKYYPDTIERILNEKG